MKSYYGNLTVDIFEMVFMILSLILVWISAIVEDATLFTITAVIYIMPRLLSILIGISNNGCDSYRLFVDVIALLALIISFIVVCIMLLNSQTQLFGENNNFLNVLNTFFVFSAVSLSDVIFKVINGLLQKFSVTIQNSKK